MKRCLPVFLALALPLPAIAEPWTPVEKIVTYPVSGASGIELYRAIGHRGPTVGKGIRAIAHTNFKLTWRRDYQVRGKACVLASAVPKLIVTYTLPKAEGRLAEPLASRWRTFLDGIAAHERVHGEQIIRMTREIEAATVGLTVENDPGCRKIRSIMTERLGAISARRQAESNAFDKTEMGADGAIGRLVIALVNSG